ncbi:MAG: triphosphoribosyl-dephospho-CoA synthase [Herminiimonas sp.]|nr:triphosphoribosyl-dephospho-CoA synthase [Herminiimonas sp.]
MNCCADNLAGQASAAVSPTMAGIARKAVASLHAELALYPKPGLVSLVDNGSHVDMTAVTFLRSLFTLRHYFSEIALAGSSSAGFDDLVRLGMAAEQRMLVATGGVNTHRGAIFFLGLLCAAAGLLTRHRQASAAITPQVLRAAIGQQWGDALMRHGRQRPPAAHGTRAAVVHGAGGARLQAASGMPAVFDIALPALQQTLAAGRSLHCARTDALFSLMAQLDDSNVYHRGGADGALLVREIGQHFMDCGGTADPHWHATALAAHRLLMSKRLSPGGAADLLAATCLVHALASPGKSADR